MVGQNKIKALRLVERISRHKLETLGSELGRLRALQSALDCQRTQLTERAEAEARRSTNDTRPYLSKYLTSVDDQQRVWAKEAELLQEQAAHLEADILGAFGELKTRETIRERAERHQAQEVARAETSGLDEAGRILFLTKKATESQKR